MFKIPRSPVRLRCSRQNLIPDTILHRQSLGISSGESLASNLHCVDWYSTYMVPHLNVIPTPGLQCCFGAKEKFRLATSRVARDKPWSTLCKKSHCIPSSPRAAAVAKFRPLTGHDCLCAHLFRFNLVTSPICVLCDTGQDMTAAHLDECSALNDLNCIVKSSRSERVTFTAASRHDNVLEFLDTSLKVMKNLCFVHIKRFQIVTRKFEFYMMVNEHGSSGRGLTAQVLSSSFDRGSELRGPLPIVLKFLESETLRNNQSIDIAGVEVKISIEQKGCAAFHSRRESITGESPTSCSDKNISMPYSGFESKPLGYKPRVISTKLAGRHGFQVDNH
ncbi:uncharacterized protein TNCV_901351 [Trichonephila clavipes]|nr:uncharacterized protein TNCV_901351 [Trichonephila clavipes]